MSLDREEALMGKKQKRMESKHRGFSAVAAARDEDRRRQSEEMQKRLGAFVDNTIGLSSDTTKLQEALRQMSTSSHSWGNAIDIKMDAPRIDELSRMNTKLKEARDEVDYHRRIAEELRREVDQLRMEKAERQRHDEQQAWEPTDGTYPPDPLEGESSFSRSANGRWEQREREREDSSAGVIKKAVEDGAELWRQMKDQIRVYEDAYTKQWGQPNRVIVSPSQWDVIKDGYGYEVKSGKITSNEEWHIQPASYGTWTSYDPTTSTGTFTISMTSTGD